MSIACSVTRLVLAVGAGFFGTLLQSCRSRRVFRRTLRRAGLSWDETDELASAYRTGLSLCGLLRGSRDAGGGAA